MISTSKGTSREFSRFGFFEFEVDGNIVKLHTYKSLDRKEDNELFIPFKDKTNGLETYSAGRYLDLEINPDDYDDCLIDFNYSYNPFCAYSEDYVCPLPPAENWLGVAIRAGEKKYH